MSASAERTALKRALGSARRLFAVVGVFSFFINVLMLVTPLYMLQIYDRVLTSRSEDTVLAITGLAVGLIAVSAFLELVRVRAFSSGSARASMPISTPRPRRPAAARQSGRRRPVLARRGRPAGLHHRPGLTAFFDSPWTPAFITMIFVFHPCSARSRSRARFSSSPWPFFRS
jgi:ATP-binding cassette subfamily C protein EexD